MSPVEAPAGRARETSQEPARPWSPSPLPALLWEPKVRAALEEDLGRAGDLTTDATVPEDARATAHLVARSVGRIAGLPVALGTFRLLDPELRLEERSADGRDAAPGEVLAVIEGRARSLLTAERVALNFLGHLSGIATTTRTIARAIEGHRGQAGRPVRVVCTRKTTPGLRALEKHAVLAGGGANHRFGLDDAVLIKDNHIALAGNGLKPGETGAVAAAIRRAKARVGHLVKIEVEVDTLAQLDEALEEGVDVVLLDNMDPDRLRQAVARIAEATGGRTLAEASGGITPETAPAIAATGVDLLSVGWITHSAPSLDVALDVVG